jgi:hypothetical protein
MSESEILRNEMATPYITTSCKKELKSFVEKNSHYTSGYHPFVYNSKEDAELFFRHVFNVIMPVTKSFKIIRHVMLHLNDPDVCYFSSEVYKRVKETGGAIFNRFNFKRIGFQEAFQYISFIGYLDVLRMRMSESQPNEEQIKRIIVRATETLTDICNSTKSEGRLLDVSMYAHYTMHIQFCNTFPGSVLKFTKPYTALYFLTKDNTSSESYINTKIESVTKNDIEILKRQIYAQIMPEEDTGELKVGERIKVKDNLKTYHFVVTGAYADTKAKLSVRIAGEQARQWFDLNEKGVTASKARPGSITVGEQDLIGDIADIQRKDISQAVKQIYTGFNLYKYVTLDRV